MEPILNLIKTRKDQNSLPGQRDDDYKLALVIEGGAMRGIVSAAMITSLEELGLNDVFDSIYATSVGAITGAYFIAKQSALGTSTYLEDLRDERFLNFKRIFLNKPPLSLEYAYDHLTNYMKPLNSKAVLKSKINLNPLASCLETRQVESLQGIKTAEELRTAFKATSCIPVIAGGPIKFRNKHYFDGALFESLPYRFALASGASHIVVLHSWPIDVKRTDSHLLEKIID